MGEKNQIEMENIVPSLSNICQGWCVFVTPRSSTGCQQNKGRVVMTRSLDTEGNTCSFIEGSDLPSRARFIQCVSSNYTQFLPKIQDIAVTSYRQEPVTSFLLLGDEQTHFPWKMTSKWSQADTSPKNPQKGRGAQIILHFPSLHWLLLNRPGGCLSLSLLSTWMLILSSNSEKVWGSPPRTLRNALETTLTIPLTRG